MSKVSEATAKQTTNVLLTLPDSLIEKLQRRANNENRSRHAQIIFILQKFFETADGNGKKEMER